jgi:hypothetical protein
MSDVKAEWAKRVLGVDVLSGASLFPEEEYLVRLETIRDDVRTYGLAREFPQFEGALKAAAAALSGRDARTGAVLDALEQRVATTLSERRRKDAAAEIAGAKALVAWQNARAGFDSAGANLQQALRTLFAASESNPRCELPEVDTAVETVDERLPPIDDLTAAVEDALDVIRGGDAKQSEGRTAAAVKAIDVYLGTLDRETMLAEIEASVSGLPIVTLIKAALGTLRATLDK